MAIVMHRLLPLLPHLVVTIITCLVCLHPDTTRASGPDCLYSSASSLWETDTLCFSVDPGSTRVKRAFNIERRNAVRHSLYTSEEKRALLNIHNHLRSLTEASNMVMLEWDSGLEKEAQRWADRCDFNHPSERRAIGRFKSIGQNLYVSTHEPSKPTHPVQSWYDEIVDYTFSKDIKCKPNKMCGHYTQVVWANTQAVGCAIRYCDHLTSVSSFDKGYLVVCEYGPAGNYLGQYPYIPSSTPCTKCPEEYKYCVRNLCSVRPFVGSKARSLHTLMPMVSARILGLVLGAMFATRQQYL